MKTVEAAQGKWRGILMHFGVDERYLRNKHQDCPLCGDGKDRYRWDDKGGNGTYFCSQCGAGTGMDLLMAWTGKSFAEAAKAVDEIVGNVQAMEPKPKSDPLKRLRKVASELVPMDTINPVRKYLHSRGLKPSPITEFHPALTYYDEGRPVGTFPAMVHLFRAADGKPATYHVTYLSSRGEKANVGAPRKVLPKYRELTGGAIQLFSPESHMGIAEGIETALAAHQMAGIPVWAAYSAGLLEQWVPPAGTERVTIFGDNDSSYTGQAAAFNLAKRLTRDGFQVQVRIPRERGRDFADEVSA